jgi:D-alanine-D-alanine ligase
MLSRRILLSINLETARIDNDVNSPKFHRKRYASVAQFVTMNVMGHKIILLHNHDNTWTPADLIEVAEDNRIVIEALRSRGHEVTDVKVYHSVEQALHDKQLNPREWIVFNWCEGYADRPWDYAGVADELEQLQYAYTGATAWTLRMTQDKRTVRTLLHNAAVPIPLGTEARRAQGLAWSTYPAIVKPINQHGSYGIDEHAVVENEYQLHQRVEYVLDTFKCPALVEEFIVGRELQATVLGNEAAAVLPAVELVFWDEDTAEPGKQIYSYDMKYSPDVWSSHGVQFICPSMMTVVARQRLQAACLQAYRAVRGRDYARFDVRLRDDQPYVVDVNPNPDINSESAVTMSAQSSGLTYTDLVVRLAELAAERRNPLEYPGTLRSQPQTATRLPRVPVP